MADEPVINRSTLLSEKVIHYSMIDGQEVIHINELGEEPPVRPDYCRPVRSPYQAPCCPDETCDGGPPGQPCACLVTYAMRCLGMDGNCYYALDEGIECDAVIEGCWCTYHYVGNDCVPY